jgi:hypothetical protein
MSALVTAGNISEAWIRTLDLASRENGNRRVHLVTAIADPAAEVLTVRNVLDEFLAGRGQQSVTTVSETIFPSSLYQDPGLDWHPGLSKNEEAVLDEAAADLYSSYIDMLPMLMTVRPNNRGTYFSRMITWPGTTDDGTNQLALRIDRLRSQARSRRRTNNTLDIDVGADALVSQPPLSGVQVYEVRDMRIRGFPCLTHIDLTLHEGALHCTAVYRHQYLIEKAYGNLVGLGALMRFLCQQGGCELGELVVHATLADAELGRGRVARLVADAEAALEVAVAV